MCARLITLQNMSDSLDVGGCIETH